MKNTYNTIMGFYVESTDKSVVLMRKGKLGKYTWKINIMETGKVVKSKLYKDLETARRLFLREVQTEIVQARL